MPQTFVGNDHTTKILQPGYPKLRRDVTSGWSVEYLYHANKSIINQLIPVPGSTAPVADADIFGLPPMVIADITVENHIAADLRILRLVYTEPSLAARSPDSEYSESNVEVTEKAITEHPDWENIGTTTTRAEKQKLLQQYYKTFQHTRVTYTFTETFEKRRYRMTEESMTEGLNNLSAPEGITSATDEKWLKTGRRIVRDNALIEITDTWIYDQSGWEDSIRWDTTLNDIIARLPEG